MGILGVTFPRPAGNNGNAMKRRTAKRVLAACVIPVALRAGLAWAADERGMERYSIITERKPFGPEAVPAVNLPPPVPPDQSMINQFRLSAVVRDNDGVIKVGLVEIKSSRNFVLDIGGSVDGVEVISADYAAERAHLRRGPEEYWVSMQGGSNRFERILPGAERAVVAPESGSAGGPRERVLPNGVDQRRSYALRRQQREETRLRRELERMRAQEAERAKTDESAGGAGVMRAGRPPAGTGGSGRARVESLAQAENIELSREEVDNLLQEYQKELIRKGMKPLPIPLTPETDRELVEEGLLPPLE